MKKFKSVGFAVIFFLAVAVVYYGFFDLSKKPTSTQQNVSENASAGSLNITHEENESSSNKHNQNDKQTYTIKEYGGNVAAFETGKSIPFKTTDVLVKDLPEGDQKMLKKGIKGEFYV